MTLINYNDVYNAVKKEFINTKQLPMVVCVKGSNVIVTDYIEPANYTHHLFMQGGEHA